MCLAISPTTCTSQHLGNDDDDLLNFLCTLLKQVVCFSIAPGAVLKFIHSGHFYSAPSSPLLLRGAPDTARIPFPEFHAEAPQATVSYERAQGPYMAVRAGVEPITLRTKCVDSTKAPPRPVEWLMEIDG